MKMPGWKVEGLKTDYIRGKTVVTFTNPKSTINKVVYYRYNRKGFQLHFWDKATKRVVFLQKGPDGKPFLTENDCLMAAYQLMDGYKPKSWGKDRSYRFEVAVASWVASSNISLDWKMQRQQIARRFFMPHFGKMDIRDVKTAHIQSLHSKLLTKGYGSKYIKNVMGELKNLFNFHRKALKEMPDFPKITVQEPVIKWLTEEEQNKVFKYIPPSDKPIFEAMRYYGLRTNEAGGLLRENVFLDHDPPYFAVATTLAATDGQIKSVTKTKRIRTLPIIPETRAIFEAQGDSPLVFNKNGAYTNRRLNRIWNKAIKDSGVQKINLYNGVRHSFACQRLNQGYSMEEVRVILGHTTSKTTQRYGAYTLQSLQDIIRGKIKVKLKEFDSMKPADFKRRIRLGGKDSNLG